VTRINCVPPRELSSKHLVAEYRELPRVIGLVRHAQDRGEKTVKLMEYRLGEGHVKFFYRRLGYVKKRYALLVAEMRRRDFKVSYPELNLIGVDDFWMGSWRPTKEAMAINRKRIRDRS
jgi:deoxyribonuclease (pyrimidine dimer)